MYKLLQKIHYQYNEEEQAKLLVYDAQNKKLCYNGELDFLNSRLTVRDKIVGQLIREGKKLGLLKKYNFFYINWKRTQLKQLSHKYKRAAPGTAQYNTVNAVSAIRNYFSYNNFKDLNYLIRWRALQYNIMFKLHISYLGKRRICKTFYINKQKREQLLWKWLGVSLRLLRNKNIKNKNYFYPVMRKFIINPVKAHPFNKLREKTYKIYLLG